MKYKPLPANFYKKNRKKLSMKLMPDSLVIIASNVLIPWKGDQHYPFTQHPDFFYLTGLEESNAILVLCPSHPLPDYREILFVSSQNDRDARYLGAKPSFAQMHEWSGIEHIEPIDRFPAFLRELSSRVRHIYVDVNPVQSDEVLHFPNERLFRQVQDMLPFHRFENVKPLMVELRMIKSDEEIEQIQHAIRITEQAVLESISSIQPGKNEFDIEAALTFSIIKQRADGFAFHPIIASGKNATILHYSENNAALQEGELVLIDIGASYGNYAADLTRTFPISGKFSDKQWKYYQVVLETLEFATRLFTPGNTIEKINQEVLKFLEEPLTKLNLLKKEDFQTSSSPVRRYFMHGVSHFVGLEVHDVGEKNTPFQPGMVLTCEPGLYIDEEGIGIRIENMLLITHEKPFILTSTIPTQPEHIQQLFTSFVSDS